MINPTTPKEQQQVLSASTSTSTLTTCCSDPCRSCMDNAMTIVCDTIPRGGGETVLSTSTTPLGIPLNGWKVLFQALLTTINVLCWYIPLRFSSKTTMDDNPMILSLANSFSGGVFLSLAFGHLLPECVHGYQQQIGGDSHDVTPYLLALSGYLLIFFVEKVAFDTHEILHHDEKEEEEKEQVDDTKASSPPTLNSAVVLLGALAVHSILEMAALGLADTFSDSAILTLSIALHQPAESIALLIAFLKSGMSKSQILQFLSIFSAMGPIGVALGMAVNEFASPLVDSIMVAIVSGTFIYVGATEVIPEEFENDSQHKWKKFASLISGMIVILLITKATAGLEV